LILGQHFCKKGNVYSLKKPYSEKVQNFCDKHEISPFTDA